MRMAPEGWPFVLAGLGLTVLVTGIGAVASVLGSTWAPKLALGAGVFLVLTAFTAFFFRDPIRRSRAPEEVVLAPADGRIVEISEVEEPTFFQGKAVRIAIFLSIFNVHVQRSPITGRVRMKTYRPGRFALAWTPKASEENEQAALGIAARERRVLVRQIAGLVARRIVTDPEGGDLVLRGGRIGLIRFGSRVELYLPPDWPLTCRPGERTRAGLTPIARMPEA